MITSTATTATTANGSQVVTLPHEPLSALESGIVQTLSTTGLRIGTEKLMGRFRVFLETQICDTTRRTRNSDQCVKKEVAQQLRLIASQLIDAANQIEGKTGPTLMTMTPIAQEIAIDGFDDVSFLIYNSDQCTEEEVFSKARQAIIAMNG